MVRRNSSYRNRCSAIINKKTRCRRHRIKNNLLCWQHINKNKLHTLITRNKSTDKVSHKYYDDDLNSYHSDKIDSDSESEPILLQCHYEILEQTEGICCYCQGPCNPCTQSCGRCIRNI